MCGFQSFVNSRLCPSAEHSRLRSAVRREGNALCVIAPRSMKGARKCGGRLSAGVVVVVVGVP